MDEPCSALGPASTNRIEETIAELENQVTIVIVTHNRRQAQACRASARCFSRRRTPPGHIVEAGPTGEVFGSPQDPRTAGYVNGRFG